MYIDPYSMFIGIPESFPVVLEVIWIITARYYFSSLTKGSVYILGSVLISWDFRFVQFWFAFCFLFGGGCFVILLLLFLICIVLCMHATEGKSEKCILHLKERVRSLVVVLKSERISFHSTTLALRKLFCLHRWNLSLLQSLLWCQRSEAVNHTIYPRGLQHSFKYTVPRSWNLFKIKMKSFNLIWYYIGNPWKKWTTGLICLH